MAHTPRCVVPTRFSRLTYSALELIQLKSADDPVKHPNVLRLGRLVMALLRSTNHFSSTDSETWRVPQLDIAPEHRLLVGLVVGLWVCLLAALAFGSVTQL